jgi:hypothetical protein
LGYGSCPGGTICSAVGNEGLCLPGSSPIDIDTTYQCAGTCAPPACPGGATGSGTSSSSGGSTLPGTCGPSRSEGEPCDSHSDCDLGLTCFSGACVTYPFITGDTCDSDDDCGGGNSTFCLSGVCKEREYEGGYPIQPPYCDSDDDCVDGRGCYQGACGGWIRLGNSCDSDFDCYGSTCVSKLCQPHVPNDAYCDSDWDCAHFSLSRCIGNTCLDVDDYDGVNCDSDYDCNGTCANCDWSCHGSPGGSSGDKGISGD